MNHKQSLADSPTAPDALKPRVKIWLEIDGDYSFGYGLCEILRAIDHAGSMKLAAVELGKSYRYVWGRIKKAEETLGCTLVQTQVGGQGQRRSSLTEFAHSMLQEFLAFRQQMIELVEQEYSIRFGKLQCRAH